MRVSSASAILAAVLAGPVSGVQPKPATSDLVSLPSLDREQLKEIAREPSSLAGRPEVSRSFDLVIPFQKQGSPSFELAAASWSYDAASGTLTFSFRPNASSDGRSVVLDYLERKGRDLEIVEPDGRSRIVPALRVRELTAEFAALPKEAGSSAAGEADFASTSKLATTTDATVLAEGSYVEILGQVSGYAHVGPSRCSIASSVSHGAEPVFSNRVTCAVGLRADTIAFRTSRGRLLASWPKAPLVDRSDPVRLASADRAAPLALSPGLLPRPDPVPPSRSEPTTSSAPARAAPAERVADQAPDEPSWVAYPLPDVVERYYPLAAYAAGRSGNVELSCLELEDGSVVDCRVLSETPERAGFGKAALALSRWFRFAPVLDGDQVLRVRLRIPYQFAVVSVVTRDGDAPVSK